MTKVKCPKCGETNPGDQSTCGRCGGTLPKVRVQSGGAQRQSPAGRPAHQTFQKGQVVANRYTILDVIGRGGMGCIYKVYDNTLKEEVALKTLLPQYVQDKLVVDRFFNEARIARQLSHPGIVRVHDIGIADRSVYISMELLKGQSLRSMMDGMGPGRRVPVKSTLQIMIQLCTALEYAHQFTVHRDIKPENVMILPNGTVKLMDFGISKLMSNQSMTATSVIMGTPHYMSPEQIKDSRNVDARADVYSIGVMLYEILTGNLPTGIPKPASQIIKDLPPSLDPIVEKCVEPQPINRYQNVSDLKQALTSNLEIVAGGSVVAGSSAPPTVNAAGTSGLRAVIGYSLVLIVAALTAFGIWGLTQQRTFPMREAKAAGVGPVEVSQEAIDRARFTRTSEFVRLAGIRTLSLQDVEELQPTLDRAAALADASLKLAADDAVRAEHLAQQALQCYLAAMPPRPNDMVFVPPGDIGEDGYYIGRYPVTVGEFSAFAASSGWADYGPLTAEASAIPVTNIPFYAALAYAAANELEIPTAKQWERAFQHRPEIMASGLYEWTRSVAGDPEAHGTIPDFGDVLLVRAAFVDENGNASLDTAQQLAFDKAGQRVGFRCVRRIPTDPIAVEARLRD